METVYESERAVKARPIVLAFARKVGRRREWVSAWPCPYCSAPEHRHTERGLQISPCGRGIYTVRWNGGRIVG